MIRLKLFATALAACSLVTGFGPFGEDPPPTILVYGDSVMSEARTYVHDELTEGSLDVTMRAFPGASLCDWAAQMPADAEQVDPDVVVIALSGVILSPCNQYDSGAGARCVAEGGGYDECILAEWKGHWRRDAEHIADLWEQRGVDVLWVSALPDPGATDPAPITGVFRKVAARHGQGFVDVARALRDRDGSWPTTLPCRRAETSVDGCTDGRIQVRRSPTNGHLCPIEPEEIGPCPVYSAGIARWGDRLVEAVFRVLERDDLEPIGDQAFGASAGSRPVMS